MTIRRKLILFGLLAITLFAGLVAVFDYSQQRLDALYRLMDQVHAIQNAHLQYRLSAEPDTEQQLTGAISRLSGQLAEIEPQAANINASLRALILKRIATEPPDSTATQEIDVAVEHTLNSLSDLLLKHIRGVMDRLDTLKTGASISFLVLIAGGIIWLLHSINPRLDQLMRAIGALSQGRYAQRTGLNGNDELGQLGAAFDLMAERLQQTLDNETAAHQALQEANQTLNQHVEQLGRTRRELEFKERNYRRLFEQSRDAMMTLDAEHFTDCNAATLELFGYASKTAFCRQHPGDISPPRQPDGRESHIAANEQIETAFRNGWNHFEWVHKKASGEAFPADVLFTVIETEDQPVLQATVRDISLEKQARQALLSSKQELEKRVEERTRDLKQANERLMKAQTELTWLAHFDSLTTLPNRNLLHNKLERSIQEAKHSGKKLAVLLLDLDRFKHINDTLGHDKGDLLLSRVAERLQQILRPKDTIARWGGDEFTIIMNEIASADDTVQFAEQLINCFTQPFDIEGMAFFTSVSIGIAIYPQDAGEAISLIKCADSAMYHAKETGKNKLQFFSHSMNERAARYLELESKLRTALKNNEFELFYQPQVDTASNKVWGIEALLRWYPDGGELVPPDQFKPIAEETGLIIPIGEWVIRNACLQARQWLDQRLFPSRIAINVSGRQFQDPGFEAALLKILDQTRLPADCLEIEITESVLMKEREHVSAVLDSFKTHGIGVSIDDFGTGYSSLSYLRRFPLDTLKVDRSFVRHISESNQDADIARSVVTLARSLNLGVIAEGVETKEQLAFLRAAGCDIMQGFLFSKPQPAVEISHFLAQADMARG